MEKKLNNTAEKVIAFLKANKGKEFTLEEISEGIGIERKSSGAITGLVKSEKHPDGIISKGAERIKIVKAKRNVSTYKID